MNLMGSFPKHRILSTKNLRYMQLHNDLAKSSGELEKLGVRNCGELVT